MAKFKSHYLELGFYVNGEYKQFNDGHFVTEDKETIELLENLADVVREDKPAEEAPKPKAPAKKSSGK
jgi:hypothetical protein